MVDWLALFVSFVALGLGAFSSYRSHKLAKEMHIADGPQVTVTCNWHQAARSDSHSLADAEIRVTNSGRLGVQIEEVELIYKRGLGDMDLSLPPTTGPGRDYVLLPQFT